MFPTVDDHSLITTDSIDNLTPLVPIGHPDNNQLVYKDISIESVKQIVPEDFHSFISTDPIIVRTYGEFEGLTDSNFHQLQNVGFNPFTDQTIVPSHIRQMLTSSKIRIDLPMNTPHTFRIVPLHVLNSICQNAPYMTLTECFDQAGLVPPWLSQTQDGYTPGHPYEIYLPYCPLSSYELQECYALYNHKRAAFKKHLMIELSIKQPELWAMYYLAADGDKYLTEEQWDNVERLALSKKKVKITIATIDGDPVGK